MTELKPHERRVLDEKLELDARLERLTAFFGTQMYTALPERERLLMWRQATHMKAYSDVLGERIDLFIGEG